jgi:hypothetical protein
MQQVSQNIRNGKLSLMEVPGAEYANAKLGPQEVFARTGGRGADVAVGMVGLDPPVEIRPFPRSASR